MHEPNIRIASWNIKDGLSDGDRAPLLVAAIEREDPTVAILCEAYNALNPGNLDNALEDFDKRNYEIIHIPQELYDDRPDQHGLVLLTKRELTVVSHPIALAGRYALRAVMHDEQSGSQYHFIGHHGNDKSEELRDTDAEALRPYLDIVEGELVAPTVVAGDLNSMRRRTRVASMLRTVGPAVRLLPSAPPDPNNPPHGLKRYASLGQRLSEMAQGQALEIVESYGLHDADPDEIPTITQRGISVKIDHIMVSKHFNVAAHSVHTRNAAENNNIHTPASDHRAISALLRIAA